MVESIKPIINKLCRLQLLPPKPADAGGKVIAKWMESVN